MKSKRGGLGRGLGALIPTGPPEQSPGKSPAQSIASGPVVTNIEGVPATTELNNPLNAVPGAHFREVPLASITPNPKQPRSVFDEEALDELKASISEVGVLQPIVVRALADSGYELVMGERRFRACQALGLESVPAIVRDTHDGAMLRDALLENIHRSNLNPLEEAAAYQQLLAEFEVTHEELSVRIGRSRPQITNTIRLLNLPPVVQRRVAAGVLSAGHARALLTIEDPDRQEALAHRIVAEGLSVRATEELAALDGSRSAGSPRKAARGPKMYTPGLDELADKLSDTFDTRVKVDIGKRKGKIVIEFATVDDLERIAKMIGVEAPGVEPPS